MLDEKRKLAMAIVGVVLATLCLVLGVVDQTTWVWAYSTTVVAFMGANGMEHLAKKKKK